MQLKLAVAVAALLSIASPLAHATPCAPTQEESAAAKATVTEFDAKLAEMSKGLASENAEVRQDAFGYIFNAVRKMRGPNSTLSSEYCSRARVVADLLYVEYVGKSEGDNKTHGFIRAESVAKALGIGLTAEQSAAARTHLRPIIEKAIAELNAATESRNAEKISDAYRPVRDLSEMALAKELKAEDAMANARKVYNELQDRQEKPQVDMAKLIAEARATIAAGKFEEATKALQQVYGSLDRSKPVPAEVNALKDEFGTKFTAAKMAEADTAVNAVKANTTDETILKAADAIYNACSFADKFGIKHERCKNL